MLWGRRHLLEVIYRDDKPSVILDHKRITLMVRPSSDESKRAEVMNEWHRSLLHKALPPMIQKWEAQLHVTVRGYFLQRMKTKWGSCNPSAGHIRLNTELVRKPKDLLEYVVVHEMVHLIEPIHSERFMDILARNYKGWAEARAELNSLPLAAEQWRATNG
jgi:predicted metal-dependent hydrolase